jgi:hypothetical protein
MRLHLFIPCMVVCVAGSAVAQEVITGRATIIDAGLEFLSGLAAGLS